MKKEKNERKIVDYKYNHECDYCGGWKDKGYNAINGVNEIGLYLDDKTSKQDRKICIKCFMKVFDTVLGKPKKIRKYRNK